MISSSAANPNRARAAFLSASFSGTNRLVSTPGGTMVDGNARPAA
ncbi:unannotated protein [freshwater metagenome]|uniref:Unannotated protein n=1 Tax=freshwater metagenome TaxID=449393 RepID=A0A6J6AGY7_9ZZZZ